MFSLSQRRQLFPDIASGSLETGTSTTAIIFNQAPSSLNGESVVCISNGVPDSRRRKRITFGVRQCGSVFNITITSKS